VRVTKNEDPRNAKQFVTVEKNIPWETIVTESCTYWMVAKIFRANLAMCSRLVLLIWMKGYKLIAETAPKLDPGEREYRFRNPVDKNGLVVLLKDIIGQLKKDERIPHGEIRSALTK